MQSKGRCDITCKQRMVVAKWLVSWGLFLERPENLLGLLKPFLVQLYPKTEECIQLRHLV